MYSPVVHIWEKPKTIATLDLPGLFGESTPLSLRPRVLVTFCFSSLSLARSLPACLAGQEFVRRLAVVPPPAIAAPDGTHARMGLETMGSKLDGWTRSESNLWKLRPSKSLPNA